MNQNSYIICWLESIRYYSFMKIIPWKSAYKSHSNLSWMHLFIQHIPSFPDFSLLQSRNHLNCVWSSLASTSEQLIHPRIPSPNLKLVLDCLSMIIDYEKHFDWKEWWEDSQECDVHGDSWIILLELLQHQQNQEVFLSFCWIWLLSKLNRQCTPKYSFLSSSAEWICSPPATLEWG